MKVRAYEINGDAEVTYKNCSLPHHGLASDGRKAFEIYLNEERAYATFHSDEWAYEILKK